MGGGGQTVISTETAVAYKNPDTGYIDIDGNATTERTVSSFNYYDEETKTWKTLENGENVTIHKRYISVATGLSSVWFSEGKVYNFRFYTADKYVWFSSLERGYGYGNGYGIMTNQFFSADGGGSHMVIYSFFGDESYGAFSCKVRPVVFLETNIVLEYDEANNSYTIIDQ